MKTNWQTKKLADICDVFDDGDWIEKKDQSPEGVRLIQTGNVGMGVFKSRGEKARFVSEKTFNKLRCTEIFPDDCLISRLPDPVGRSCIVPNTTEKMITSVDCTIVRFKKEIISQWFVYYSLSDQYQDQINRLISGATRQRISRNNLGLIRIPLASIAEQKRIIGILDGIFESIAKAKVNAEKNLQNSKDLFESNLREIYSNSTKIWQLKKLGDICDLQNGYAFKSNDYVQVSNTMNFRMSQIRPGGTFDLNNNPRYLPDKYSEIYKSFLLNDGDVVIAMTDLATETKILGIPTIVKSDGRNLLLNQRVGRLSKIDKSVIQLPFLRYILTSPQVNEYYKSLGRGGLQINITKQDILNVKIPIPPIAEQLSIVNTLDSLSSETKNLEKIYQQKLDDLEELKKSILGKAFSGDL